MLFDVDAVEAVELAGVGEGHGNFAVGTNSGDTLMRQALVCSPCKFHCYHSLL